MTAPDLPRELEDLLHCFALARMPIQELKDAYIRAAVDVCRGNLVQAAKLLGMNRRTLYRRGFSSTLPCARRPA